MKKFFENFKFLFYYFFFLFTFQTIVQVECENYIHNPIQYYSQNQKGSYNFGYDTGVWGAHQFHQENKDESGEVRGRYGYTDPDGNLRLVYYTAGVNGFNSWSPDDQPSTPSASFSSPYAYSYASASKSQSSVQSPSPSNVQSFFKSGYLSPSQVLRYEKIRSFQKSYFRPNPQKDDSITTPVNEPIRSEAIKQEKSFVHKTHYSPVEQYKSQAKSQVKSSVKYSQSADIQQVNFPTPIAPAQYKSNYEPSGPYTHCYCR